MNWKRLWRVVLFPPWAVLLLLPLPVAAWLIYGLLRLTETHPLRIASYVVAFYALSVWCARIPEAVRLFGRVKKNNRLLRRWLEDPGLRVNVSLVGSVLWNGAYAALQLGLGIYHREIWFYSLAAYYALLAGLRFYLVRHTLRHKPGERPAQERKRYRACGWVFLLMNLALSGMMLYMIQGSRAVHHHEITTIAMAAYTFTTLTMAILNVIRYRRYQSPALSAAKAISLAAACVSMLTLENTMLTTFGTEAMTHQTQTLFLGLSGGAVSAWIIAMAVYMLTQGRGKTTETSGDAGQASPMENGE